MESNALIFVGAEPPVALSDLEAVEQEYGFVLPADYKTHLLAHNGGWPKDRDTFWPPQEGAAEPVARTISDFYSVRHGDETLEDALEDLHDQLHPDLVPFGSDSGGDQFLLSVGPEDYGSVYYLSHEYYTPPKRKARKQPRAYGPGVNFLAPSFSTFLQGLVVNPTD
ncbi:MAG: SMI1/KNR4 family protein [Bacteroidota bacterium]|nr:SMI1/KNR4 family protein [Bacteroidota bacterium]